MSAPKLALIGNRRAGRCKLTEIIREAESVLWGYEIEVYHPKDIDELVQLVGSFRAPTYRGIVFLGGDGTVNRALPGLMGSEIPTYTFPTGTANDLAAEIAISSNWKILQRLIDQNRYLQIDLIRANDLFFMTVAGIGFGAGVAKEYNDMRRQPRALGKMLPRLSDHIYSILSAKHLLLRTQKPMSLRLKGRNLNRLVETSCLMICNQAKLGGNLTISASSKNQDGKFEVVYCEDRNTIDLARFVLDVRLGKNPHRAVRLSASQLQIEECRGRKFTLFGDGEILLQDSNLELKLYPRALKLFSPMGKSHPIGEAIPTAPSLVLESSERSEL